jgi:hypothetical protein
MFKLYHATAVLPAASGSSAVSAATLVVPDGEVAGRSIRVACAMGSVRSGEAAHLEDARDMHDSLQIAGTQRVTQPEAKAP